MKRITLSTSTVKVSILASLCLLGLYSAKVGHKFGEDISRIKQLRIIEIK